MYDVVASYRSYEVSIHDTWYLEGVTFFLSAIKSLVTETEGLTLVKKQTLLFS